MSFPLHKKRIGWTCIVFSVLAHLAVLFPIWNYGRYHFVKPVLPLQAVLVELAQASRQDAPVRLPEKPKAAGAARVQATAQSEAIEDRSAGGDTWTLQPALPPPTVPNGPTEPTLPPVPEIPPVKSVTDLKDTGVGAPAQVLPKKATVYPVQPPLRQAGEFLATARERLTYQISMFNVPVGSAELEAKREKGEVRISLKVKSSPALAGIYPVDDVVETRHIGGNYILTRIRQREGSFRSDRAFTLMLRDKKVFWIDRLTSRSLNETVPSSDVTDLISALYFLRNRPLQVSRTETLHVYDSETYAEVPVEVLRREQIDLPGLRKADTIVVKPVLQSGGIFKRTGDLIIWLTDDADRVPVQVETQIPLGKVTVALVAADSETDGATSENVSAKADTE